MERLRYYRQRNRRATLPDGIHARAESDYRRRLDKYFISSSGSSAMKPFKENPTSSIKV
jgi:hypothetical protein